MKSSTKKIILSLLIVTVMVLGLLPPQVQAVTTLDMQANNITISAAGNYEINGTGTQTTNTITVATDIIGAVNIKLSNVNIAALGGANQEASAFKIGLGSLVNLTLLGENTLKGYGEGAGIEVECVKKPGTAISTAILNITSESTGSLNASGYSLGNGFSSGGAGIGSRGTLLVGANAVPYLCGAINIHGGTIIANGGDFGAGIGGGGSGTSAGDGGMVVITGGNVTANGGKCGGAGIGSGASKSDGGNGGSLRISGGTVTAVGGCINSLVGSGAGIGGGGFGQGDVGGSAGEVVIEGGTVHAQGAPGAAGIGGGTSDFCSRGGNGGFVVILGGEVTANGGNGDFINSGGAGIGGGSGYGVNAGNGGMVTISGGKVIANGGAGADDTISTGGAGIGGGGAEIGGSTKSGFGGVVNISGGIVFATGGNGAATGHASGIGGGGAATLVGGVLGSLDMSGGTVIATGAGIGSGIGNYLQITVTGGTLNSKNGTLPAVYDHKIIPQYLTTLNLPGINEITGAIYTVDDGTPVSCSTDADGKLYLWQPSTGSPTDIKITAKGMIYEVSATVTETSGNNNFTASEGSADAATPVITIVNDASFTVTLYDANGKYIGENATVYGTITGTVSGNDTILTGTLADVPSTLTEVNMNGGKIKIKAAAPPSTTLQNPSFY